MCRIFRCAPHPLQERRERLMKEQLEKMRADNPKITEQFADLKRDLAQVIRLAQLLLLRTVARGTMCCSTLLTEGLHLDACKQDSEAHVTQDIMV